MKTRERVMVEDVLESTILAGTPSLQVLLEAGVRAVQSTPLISSSGKLLGVICTHYDAAHRPRERELRLMDLLSRQAADYLERKQAEDALRISEERLRLAQISGNVGVWDWDVKGNQLQWTPELEAIFGLEPGTVRTYDHFSTRVHPDDLEMVERKRDEALRKHDPFEMEFRIIHASGKTRWVNAKGRGFYDDSGQLVRVLGNNIDITELKQAEEEARTASELLRRFLNAAPTGLVRYSRDLRCLSANSAYARLAGLPMDQVMGRRLVDVIGEDAWETVRPYVERVLRGERVEFEALLSYPAAGSRELHVVYTPERDGHEEVVGWVASVSDITEFKRVEKQLQDVEKIAAAGQLAASLAHEINNPLSAVINVLYLLEGSPDIDKTSKGLISIANNEIARVARIVRQSLSYYRVGMMAREVDLAVLVDESLQVFSDKFRNAGIAVSKSITSGTSVIGFADEIRQVVDNLLINAVEATPREGRLKICLRRSCSWKNRGESGARLTIADNGCGIPKAYLSKVFDPFFTTKAEKGTGLGLWVVKGIVEKHGGSIKVRSTDVGARSGTVISIFWPSTLNAHSTRKLDPSEYAA
jgi:PAS domain S-box-containing protein